MWIRRGRGGCRDLGLVGDLSSHHHAAYASKRTPPPKDDFPKDFYCVADIFVRIYHTILTFLTVGIYRPIIVVTIPLNTAFLYIDQHHRKLTTV